MIKMICVLGLVCLCSTATQDPKSDPWKTCLLPPRNNTELGFTCTMVAGKLQTICRDPSDKLAQRGWIEHRLKKQPGNIQLWQEYLELLEKSDVLRKPSCEKALLVVQEALKLSPNDPKLMLLRIQLYDKMELTEQERQALAELNQKHPQFIPGRIASNELAFFDKKYDECIKFARELAKKYPDNAEASVHLSSRIYIEICRRLNIQFPDKVIDYSSKALRGVHKEYQDQLAKLQDDPVRTKELESEYAAVLQLADEGRKAIKNACDVLAKDESQRWQTIYVIFCDIALEACQACLIGKDEVLDDRAKMIGSMSKELNAVLTLALSNKEDACLQSAAVSSLLANLFMRMEHDDSSMKQLEIIQQSQGIAEDELFNHLAAILKKLFPSEHATARTIIANLKKIPPTDYPPIVALIEHSLGVVSVFIEGDLLAAREHFTRALQLDPRRKNTYQSFLGTCSRLKEKLNWDQLPVAVREHQDTAEGHALFVKALLNSDHPDEAAALRHVSIALKHDPRHPVALILKATLLARKDPNVKTLGEAAALCEQAFELANQHKQSTLQEPEYYLIAGTIDVLRGKSFAARRYFEDGLQIKPKDVNLKQAIERMNGVVQVEGRDRK